MANFQGKVSDDLYDRLEQLKAEAGGTHAEFLERMANAYELHKVRQGDNLLSAEAEELESLTARINRLMVNANEKINSALRDKDLVHEEKQSTNEELIARLREDLSKLKENNAEMKKSLEEANKSNTELTEKLKEAEEQSILAKDLVTEYKDKNDNLSAILGEYKADREMNKQLVEEISTLKETLAEAQNKANSEAEKVLSLTKEKDSMEQGYIDKITSLKEKHRQAIDHLDALKGLAIKEARAEEKEQAQLKLQAHMDKENELRDRIDNLKATIDVLKEEKEKSLLELKEKYENELSDLQKELEKSKKSTVNNRTSEGKAEEVLAEE